MADDLDDIDRLRNVDHTQAAACGPVDTPCDAPVPSEVDTATTLALGSIFDATYEDVTKLIESAGGPRQFLHQSFPIRAERHSRIAAVLMKAIGDPGDVPYVQQYPFPVCLEGAEDEQAPFFLPLWAFSAETESSLREPPTLDVTTKLINNFERDGFVTTSEPILIRIQMAVLPTHGDVEIGSIWYLKGAARIQTAMAVVVALDRMGKEAPQVLKNSLQRIKCKHIRLKDRQSELFFNMKRSAKNSIRRAPSAISWVYSFVNLSAWGQMDATAMIRSWNDDAPKHDRIVGFKASAVKVLLELPEPACKWILHTVSMYGWESCPYSDDCFGTKKILVGYNAKSGRASRTSQCATRLKNSKDSVTLLFEMVHAQFSNTKPEHRRRVTKLELEGKAEVTACACSVVEELTAQIPNVEEALRTKFLNRLRNGDLTLQMELSSACAERNDNWNCRENSCILEILNELTPGKVVGDGKAEAALHKSATDLDTAGYQLLLEELQFDERCLEVYKGKLSNFEVRVAQLRDSWRQKRNQHAKDAILKWMDFNVESFAWPSKFDAGSALTMMKRVEEAASKWQSVIKCRDVALLFVCNYAAPSLVKADVTTGTFSMIGHMLGSQAFGPMACGVMLCPTFSYQKHRLFIEEHTLLQMLASNSCLVDMIFQLNFDPKSKTDQRDQRPLAYTGRILAPGDMTQDWLWRDSSLVKLRRNTNEAKQLSSKHMVVQEDMSPTSLPSATDTPIQGAQKYSQVGADAARKLLQSAVDGVPFGNQIALMVVDCTPLVGNFFEGFIDMASDVNIPSKYVPIFGDDSAEEWFFSYFQQELTRRFQTNDFKIRNAERMAEDPPQAHMESKPEPPTLKRCVWGKVNGEICTIEIPEAEVKKWWGREEWRVFVQDFQDRHPSVKKLEKETPKASSVGKTGGFTTPTPKKRCLEVDYSGSVVAEAGAPGNAKIKEVGILNARFPPEKKSADLPSLVVSDAGPYIQNSTGFAVTLQFGSVLCGWGKGKFREKGQKPCDENEIEFVATADMVVLFDNKCCNLSEILDSDKSSQTEGARVAYHKVSQDPSGTWTFNQEHSVIFTPQPEDDSDAKINQAQVAKFTSKKAWDSSVTTMGWHVRRTQKGISPVRPIVLLTTNVTLESGKVLVLQN